MEWMDFVKLCIPYISRFLKCKFVQPMNSLVLLHKGGSNEQELPFLWSGCQTEKKSMCACYRKAGLASIFSHACVCISRSLWRRLGKICFEHILISLSPSQDPDPTRLTELAHSVVLRQSSSKSWLQKTIMPWEGRVNFRPKPHPSTISAAHFFFLYGSLDKARVRFSCGKNAEECR